MAKKAESPQSAKRPRVQADSAENGRRGTVRVVPLQRACRTLDCDYQVAWKYYARGILKGYKRRGRIFVTEASLNALVAALLGNGA